LSTFCSPKLTDDELAFYDALEVNDSAVAVLGDGTLRIIARELVEAVRKSVRIDWTIKESVRAQIRIMVKRILKEVRLAAPLFDPTARSRHKYRPRANYEGVAME
jgi:hypothetical protein